MTIKGIYILKTRHPQAGILRQELWEWRVAPSADYGSFHGKFNDTTKHYDGDPTYLFQTFFISPKFSSEIDALQYAKKISALHNHALEDGIVTINDWAAKTWDELVTNRLTIPS